MKMFLSTRRCFLSFILLGSLFAGFARAEDAVKPNIPSLTWTPRSDWVNVKDAPYGAKGDGNADDTAAIQEALQAVNSPKSKFSTVYLPPGTYKITASLNWWGSGTVGKGPHGVAFIGCGRETVIKWAGPSGGSMFVTEGATRSRYLGVTWDGQGTAATAYNHEPHVTYESRVRHENEAFWNFTGTAITAYGGGDKQNAPTAEIFVWNCLFQHCGKGIVVGSDAFNNYQWLIIGCEFDDCGTGVETAKGKAMICDSHFERSSVTDILIVPSICQSVRRCTSTGSAAFLTFSSKSNGMNQVVEDCQVDGWTGPNGAIQLGGNSVYMIFDCVFSNPPDQGAPMRVLNEKFAPPRLIVCNNRAGSMSEDSLIDAKGATIVTIPPGKRGPSPITPQTHFLKTTWPSDSTHILDVTQSPYNAKNDGKDDATAAIQKAIDDAKSAANGSIVYLPIGKYNVSGTLNITGKNYTIQGSGDQSMLDWSGSSPGVVMQVDSPDKLSLEQFDIQSPDEGVAGVQQTAMTPGQMTYDGVYYGRKPGSGHGYILNGRGIELVKLPAGSRVLIQHIDSPLTVDDCGPAEIVARYMLQGVLIVKGATQPKTGFLGFLDIDALNMTHDPNCWDITVADNQNLVCAHYYHEQGFNHLHVTGGAGTTPGHVTLQGVKQQTGVPDSLTIQIDNYNGRVMYGPQYFQKEGAPTYITQTGSNPCDIILPGDIFMATKSVVGPPVIKTDTGGRLIQVQNIYLGKVNTGFIQYMPDVIPDNGLASVAAGLDDLQQLGAEDLKWNYPDVIQTK